MAEKDVYEALLDLYRQDPFDLSQVTDSLMEVLRLQFTPEEAELAVTVGFEGGALVEKKGPRSNTEKVRDTKVDTEKKALYHG